MNTERLEHLIQRVTFARRSEANAAVMAFTGGFEGRATFTIEGFVDMCYIARRIHIGELDVYDGCLYRKALEGEVIITETERWIKTSAEEEV